MDGVFMKRIVKAAVCIALAAFLWGVIRDKQLLQDGLIRLHVVGASNSKRDQTQKLQVRDAVLEVLTPILETAENKEQAAKQVEARLPQIGLAAETCLRQLGEANPEVTVQLCRETFARRDYDTFSLPAGVYDSLRVRIGSGEGKNWWCVVFPSLCMDGFRDTAVSAGFSETLTDTLEGDNQVRFFFLDCLGWVENFLFAA